MGLTISQMFQSRFVSATEFDGKNVTLTIVKVELEDLEREDGTERAAVIVSFKETKRQMVLNRTNALSIAAMFGDDSDRWLGKRVTFYPEHDNSPVNATGWAIRVKGSPDIDKTITATIKLPRRRPAQRTLRRTAAKDSKATFTEEANPQPHVDTETGEYLDECELDFGDDGMGEG